MYECDTSGCPEYVSHPGQLCLSCRQRQDAEFEADCYDEDHDDDDDEWECAYPGKCLMPSIDHLRSECHTVEDMEAYYAEVEGL